MSVVIIKWPQVHALIEPLHTGPHKRVQNYLAVLIYYCDFNWNVAPLSSSRENIADKLLLPCTLTHAPTIILYTRRHVVHLAVDSEVLGGSFQLIGLEIV